MPNKYLDSVGLAEYTSLVKADLATKAPLASPALTGTPTAPTPTAGDDSTKIATTEFVNDAIDAEETRADGAYLPFTGGSITGNLSVSGTIAGDVTGDLTGNVTGNVTGDLTGNANTATNATNDGNGDEIATTYLPLSGGTMTGQIYFNVNGAGLRITKSGDAGQLSLSSATTDSKGAYITLHGENYSALPGQFRINAADTSHGKKTFVGNPSGSLTWAGKEIERVNAIGTGYIRYESGLQICWGGTTLTASTSISYAVPFAGGSPRPYIGAGSNVTLYATSPGDTGFTAQASNYTNSPAFRYVAIGWWK